MTVNAVVTGFPTRCRTDLAARQYWSIRESLSLDDGLGFFGSRIVMPVATRCGVLAKLNASHQGIVRMKQRAQQVSYWSGLSNDIVQLVESAKRVRNVFRACRRSPCKANRCPLSFSRLCQQICSSPEAYMHSFTPTASRVGPWSINAATLRRSGKSVVRSPKTLSIRGSISVSEQMEGLSSPPRNSVRFSGARPAQPMPRATAT